MPNTTSAKKALRASDKKRVFNDRRRVAMRNIVKDIKKLITEKKSDKAKALLSDAYKAIDKAVKRGVIKKNTGSRKKSRLSSSIKNSK